MGVYFLSPKNRRKKCCPREILRLFGGFHKGKPKGENTTPSLTILRSDL